MPRIIAQHLAREVEKCQTEEEVRHTMMATVETAREAGFAGKTAELFDELCEQLRQVAADQRLATVRRIRAEMGR